MQLETYELVLFTRQADHSPKNMQARKMLWHAKLQRPQRTASSLSSIMSSVWFKFVTLTLELLSPLVSEKQIQKLQYMFEKSKDYHPNFCSEKWQ